MSETTTPGNAAAGDTAVPGTGDQTTTDEAAGGVPEQPGGGAGEATATAPERPEHIPEKFWDAEMGAPRIDDLAKSYAGLESLLGKRVDALDEDQRQLLFDSLPDKALAAAREQLKTDDEFVREIVEAHKPQAPEAYEQPKDVLPEGFSGFEEEDPRYQAAQEFARANGLGQEQFNELVKLGVDLMPDLRPLSDRMKAVDEKFETRSRQAMTMARNLLPDQHEQLEALESRLYAPEDFLAYEALVQKAAKEPTPAAAETKPTEQMTQAKLDQLMQDPRYYTDKAYHAEVTRKWNEFHGEGATL